jgi:hypothetical protein
MNNNNNILISSIVIIIVVIIVLLLLWYWYKGNDKKNNENMSSLWATTPQYIGGLQFSPDLEGFDPRGRLLRPLPDENFDPKKGIPTPKDTFRFKSHDKVVPYNKDIMSFLYNKKFTSPKENFSDIDIDEHASRWARSWNATDEQKQKYKQGLLTGRISLNNGKLENGLNKFNQQENKIKEGFQLIMKEDFDPGTFRLFPAQYTDRDIRGCPNIFPITEGAYAVFYVMAAELKKGGLVYEYYGRSKGEAREKYKNAFPGCKIPDSIK